ncbi:MAG: zinc ribbon domain-containing protein [Chloroflexota bacterium]
MQIDDKFIDQVSRGFIPPLSKALAEQPSSVIAERLFTLPGESITWIGKVHFSAQLTSWGPEYTGFMQLGASDLRFIFIDSGGFSAAISISFWFNVDFEGQIWQRGTISKKEYTTLLIQPPLLKKEMLSREIHLTNTAIRTNGKQDKILEIRLNDLKWRNPQTQKYEGGKVDNLLQEMMGHYNQRRQVKLRTLKLMMTDPEAFVEEMFATLSAEGQVSEGTEAVPPCSETKPTRKQAIRAATPSPQPQPSPTPARRPVVSAPAVYACPSCGKILRPGVKFCGNCGAQFGDQAAPGGVKSVSKSKPKPARSGKNTNPEKTPSAAICPSCGKALRPGATFCGNCGTKLEAKPAKTWKEDAPLSCGNCGKPVEPDWIACPFCGKILHQQFTKHKG